MDAGFRNDSQFRKDISKEDPALAMLLASMPDWIDKEISLACFTGGLSNQVYKIEIANQPYVFRVPSKNSLLLGGAQIAEVHNTIIAGDIGVGPRVLKFIEGSNGLVLEYIEGVPLTTQLLTDDRVVSSVIATLKKLHNGPKFGNVFSMSDLIVQYTANIADRYLDALEGFKSRSPNFDIIRIALESTNIKVVPCHNDAFPKNWILDRDYNARLIDFEYSGNNDPAFDLATLYVEGKWSDSQLQHICTLYYGESPVRETSRVWLHSILFDVGWALYAVIKSSITSDAARFSKIALVRWERACAKLDSFDFERHVEMANK